MKGPESYSENYIDHKISMIDLRYRESFKDLIIVTKKLTHHCQYKCYDNIKNNLQEAETCAKDCFKPMLHIKKNISQLIENCKDKLVKCKYNASSSNKDERYGILKIEKCLESYEEELFKTRDEAEYIYNGYMKSFPEKIDRNNI